MFAYAKKKNEQICQKSRAYLTEYTSFWSDFSKFCEKKSVRMAVLTSKYNKNILKFYCQIHIVYLNLQKQKNRE